MSRQAKIKAQDVLARLVNDNADFNRKPMTMKGLNSPKFLSNHQLHHHPYHLHHQVKKMKRSNLCVKELVMVLV
jgi:hypothetical protein